jgi:membrane associated rhomboid family serine protease
MLEDRDYMRQPEFRESRISLTVAILILNAVVFLVQMAASSSAQGQAIQDHYFALSLAGLAQGYIWQLLTYQFMHANLWHILLNSWAIFVFGREIEAALGWKKFLTLYLSSGVLGGIFQMLAAMAWPEHFGGAVVGASAAGFGLIAAFAALFPDRELTLLLFFVIPLRLSARTLLILSAVLAVAGVVFPTDNIANAAHLGGMVMGFIFVRQFIQGRWWQWKFPVRRSAPREFVTARVGRGKFWRSAAGPASEDLSAEEFLQKEVDPILDKISAHGIQSLTAREREILEKARTKMAKR